MARKVLTPEKLVEMLNSSLEKESTNPVRSEVATVLTAAARLENTLMTILSSFLIKSETADNMFKPSGSLESFSKCTQMAYCLGFITDAVRKNLETIGRIRNHFAHHMDEMDFRDETTVNLCKVLILPDLGLSPGLLWPGIKRQVEADPQAKFSMISHALLVYLGNILSKVKRRELEPATNDIKW